MSNKPGNEVIRRLIKPTLDTQFHIDYAWWEGNERQLQVYLMSFLPEDKRHLSESQLDLTEVDWIDPITAEVHRIDPIAQAIRDASRDVDYSHTSLVDAVFRVFLINNNTPMTPNELGEIVGRPPLTILRTIAGARVYKGLRPVADN